MQLVKPVAKSLEISLLQSVKVISVGNVKVIHSWKSYKDDYGCKSQTFPIL